MTSLSTQASSTSKLDASGELAVKRPITVTLALALLLGVLVPIGVAVLLIYRSSAHSMDQIAQSSEKELRKRAFDQLVAVREIKCSAVERHLQSIVDQVITFSEDRMIVGAMREMKAAFRTVREENGVTAEELKRIRRELASYYTNDFSAEYRKQNEGRSPETERYFNQLDDDSIVLQYYYIRANTNPLGEKHRLDRAADKSRYSELHAALHPVVRNYLEKFGYYDIFLCDPETGDIVYSVFKELDYSTSLNDGPYAQTNFGEAFRRANQASGRDGVVLVDYEQYLPSSEAPASFIASPIFEGGEKIGVAMFQMPIHRLNTIMAERDGLGETGETYLVGSDLLMRSDSYLDPEKRSVVASFRHPEKGKVDTEAVKAALKGEQGEKVIIDYNGNSVLSAYVPIDLHSGIRWALLAEIDEAEAFAAVGQVRKLRENTAAVLAAWSVGLSGVCLLAISLVGLGIHWKIAQPIRRMAFAAGIAAGGNLDVQMATEGKSEVAMLGRALNRMITNLRNVVAQINSAGSKMVSASREQAEGAKNQSVATEEMASTVTELLASAKKMTENAASVAKQAELAVSECTNGTTNVESAVEGIKGVHERVEKIAAHMLELGGKSQQINSVLDIITELSEQTNLLSLNASIEAAGAGDAGKRFAVVASEIRKLAERATDSTEEIRSLIDGIQETVNSTIMATEEGTKAVQESVRLTEEADKSFERIAGQVASTTQSAKAIEMGSRQQATAIEQMESAVKNVDTTAQQTAETARRLDTDSQALLETARQLQRTEQELQE